MAWLHFITGGHLGKSHGMRRCKKPVQVVIQLGDLPVVNTDAFPNGVTTLDNAIKNRDFGFITVQQFAAYVDFYIAVTRGLAGSYLVQGSKFKVQG